MDRLRAGNPVCRRRQRSGSSTGSCSPGSVSPSHHRSSAAAGGAGISDVRRAQTDHLPPPPVTIAIGNGRVVYGSAGMSLPGRSVRPPYAADVDGESQSSDDELLKLVLEEDELEMGGLFMFGMYHDTYFQKAKRRKATETGHDWVMRNLADSGKCYNMFRMSRPLYDRLHDLLVESYGLKSTRNSSSVEALGVFLWMVGAPQAGRQAENQLERSLETVTVPRYFDKVLKCVLELAGDIIRPVDPKFRTMHRRLQNPRFFPHFNNCIGALDGTHIPVVVPNDKVVQHLCLKRFTTQNVLAVCDFDMRFTFAISGWPGSVHDMRVFDCAINEYKHRFPHPPPGKFYLVDYAYPNRPGYLAPYKKTKYHLSKFQKGPMPKDMKETFNFAHSSLRNVVAESVEVLKMKWRILLEVPNYPIEKQSHIIVACMALHNFIRESGIADKDFDRFDRDENYVPREAPTSQPPTWNRSTQARDEPPTWSRSTQARDEGRYMNAFRDEIAYGLFNR